MSKLIISLIFIIFISAVGAFVALAVWDVPVAQKVVEKPVDTARFLNKKS